MAAALVPAASRLPPPRAVAGVASAAIVFLFESGLRLAAEWVVMVLRSRQARTCHWVVIGPAILLSALPAPGAPTARAHVELPTRFKPAGKHIVARRILEGPAAAPRTLLCINAAIFLAHPTPLKANKNEKMY